MKCFNCFKEHAENLGMCPYCGWAPEDYQPDAYFLLPGHILNGRYLLGVVTGVGGFGVVYKAWDMKLERVVAIKEFYPSGMVNRIPGKADVIIMSSKNRQVYEYNKSRFLCEARNTVKFSSHKNIINVYEYFEANNTAYIVMDLLQGIALNKYMKGEGKIEVNQAVYVMSEVCEALKMLHKQKVIHRDISPDNIYLCDDKVILFDFGTAEFADDNVKVLDVVVKEGYSPIEQYDNVNQQGPWTDIYALGATMYVMLTGVRPPESNNRRINDELVPPHMLDTNIPENISNAIMKAMAVDKHMRFSTVAEFQKAIQGEKKVVSLEKERKKRKRNRLLAIASMLAIVIISAGILIYNMEMQKRSVTLDPADLTIWISGDVDSEKYKAMQEIVDSFCEAHKNVKIEIVAYSNDEYYDKINEAMKKAELPNIFESTEISEEDLTGVVNLKSVVKGDNSKECYFIDDYKEIYDKYYQIPLGVNIPAAYYLFSGENHIEYKNDTVKNADDFKDDYAINSMYKKILNETFDSTLKSSYDYYDFTEGKAMVLYSSTKDYSNIEEKYSGRFHIVGIESKEISCQYDNVWSVGEGNKAEEKASMWFVEYMMSQKAQDIMYLTYKSEYMPINKDTFEEYTVNIFGNEMSEFFDLIDKYQVKEVFKNE